MMGVLNFCNLLEDGDIDLRIEAIINSRIFTRFPLSPCAIERILQADQYRT